MYGLLRGGGVYGVGQHSKVLHVVPRVRGCPRAPLHFHPSLPFNSIECPDTPTVLLAGRLTLRARVEG